MNVLVLLVLYNLVQPLQVMQQLVPQDMLKLKVNVLNVLKMPRLVKDLIQLLVQMAIS